MPQPKALFFDIFGTIVDWRRGVARETAAILQPLGFALDWFALADVWRDEYQPSMEEVRSKRQAYCKLDVLHRRNLLAIANVLALRNCRKRQSTSSPQAGTGSTPGPMSARGCSACAPNSYWRPCQTAIFP
jgi:hypothetical protein